MAQQLNTVQRSIILYSIAVIEAIPETGLPILTHGALLTVHRALCKLLPKPPATASVANQASPPATPEMTLTERKCEELEWN
jgi:hypothetical protein